MVQDEGISLYTLLTGIRKVLYDTYQQHTWVVAEINSVTRNRNGHIYLELIDKKEGSDKILATAKGIIWANMAGFIASFFEETTGRPLSSGIKILFRATIEFHEIYGLSLVIVEIEPAFTLGALEKARQETINKLKAEGIFSLNKELFIPIVPQRLAVISSETAAGFGDFMHQLANNKYGIHFQVRLFTAFMQGDNSPQSIASAFEAIYEEVDDFDAVVVIRGGGSKSDLVSFDSYLVASYAAQFPLPVIAGIGHERDTSVLDLVAHTSLKTPTAVAEFVIEKAGAVYESLLYFTQEIEDFASSYFQSQKQQLQQLAISLSQLQLQNIRNQQSLVLSHSLSVIAAARAQIQENRYTLQHTGQLLSQKSKEILFAHKFKFEKYSDKLKSGSAKALTHHTHSIADLQMRVESFSPENILKKGYAMVLHENKLLKSASSLHEGDYLNIRLHDGSIGARVVTVKTDDMTDKN